MASAPLENCIHKLGLPLHTYTDTHSHAYTLDTHNWNASTRKRKKLGMPLYISQRTYISIYRQHLLEHRVVHLTQPHSPIHSNRTQQPDTPHTTPFCCLLLQRMADLLKNNVYMIYVWIPLCKHCCETERLLKVIVYANTNSISILLDVNGWNRESATGIISIENE